MKLRYTFLRKAESIFSPLIWPDSMASVMKVRPLSLSFLAVALYMHHAGSMSILSMSAVHLAL